MIHLCKENKDFITTISPLRSNQQFQTVIIQKSLNKKTAELAEAPRKDRKRFITIYNHRHYSHHLWFSPAPQVDMKLRFSNITPQRTQINLKHEIPALTVNGIPVSLLEQVQTATLSLPDLEAQPE